MMAARAYSKKPGRVLAAGLIGGLLTAALVGACFAGIRNPYTSSGNDLEAVFGQQAVLSGGIDPSFSSPTHGQHDSRYTPVTLLSSVMTDTILGAVLDNYRL